MVVRVEIDASRVEEVRYDAAPGAARVRWRVEATGPGGSREAEGVRYTVSRRVRRTLKIHPRFRRLSVVLVVNRLADHRSAAPAIHAAIGFSEQRGDRFMYVER